MTTKDEVICDREETRGEQIVAYLYEDLEAGERARFEMHLSQCLACRRELAALGGVRAALEEWTPPERSLGTLAHPSVPPPRRLAVLADMPAWASTAAALLCVGLAAGLANLHVRYDDGGLVVRTGWLSGSDSAVQPSPAEPARPWQADLAALEEGLRAELAGSRTPAVADPGAGADADALGRVSALIDESEQRQRRELALRLADLVRDAEYRRRDDLEKIDRSLGLIQANLGVMQTTGVEVMRQRQMLNDLAVRVSQR